MCCAVWCCILVSLRVSCSFHVLRSVLLLQPFLSLCPIGVLGAEVQPLTEMLSAVLGANTAALMETIGNVLQHCHCETEAETETEGGRGREGDGGKSGARKDHGRQEKITLLRDETKSLRLVMHCLRAICLLCGRCPRQMRGQVRVVLVGPVQVHLLLLPLPAEYKTERIEGQEVGGESSAAAAAAALARTVAALSLDDAGTASTSGGGRAGGGREGEDEDECRRYCRRLWLSVCVTCRVLRTTCPEEWRGVWEVWLARSSETDTSREGGSRSN
jgi:hypothetical protein